MRNGSWQPVDDGMYAPIDNGEYEMPDGYTGTGNDDGDDNDEYEMPDGYAGNGNGNGNSGVTADADYSSAQAS